MSFSKYVSLGYNCEIAFVLQEHGFPQTDDLFAWTWAPISGVTEMISRNFSNVFEEENLEPQAGSRMIQDRLYGVFHHSPFHHDGIDEFGGPRHKRIYEFSRALVEKKIAAFRNDLESGAKVAYIVKYDEPLAKRNAIELRDAILRRHASGDFLLIVVQEEGKREAEWGENRIANRYVSRFADIQTANEFDRLSWQRVLEEFPVVNVT